MTGAAHGLRAWLLQRFTAIYLIGFLLFLVVRFGILGAPVGYHAWHAWLAEPIINMATGLFMLSVIGHAWVGIRDVIMDYVRPSGLRVAVLAAAALALIACAAWALRVLFLVTVKA
ncbi:MAG: succinate dehydrogenase, hydrophobic membrane anchor protein [Gammaproteobacteria bacterium]